MRNLEIMQQVDSDLACSRRVGGCGRRRATLLLALVLALSGCGQPANHPEVQATGVSVPSPHINPTVSWPGFLRRPSPGLIRVMSYNVNWDAVFPDDDPKNHPLRAFDRSEEFARVVAAIQPDIICLQEINPVREAVDVAALVGRSLPLPGGHGWQAWSYADTFIVARYELAQTGSGRVLGLDRGHAMALVDLPDPSYEKDLYVICAHAKSGGGETNVALRQGHADTVMSWVRDLRTSGGEQDLVLGTPLLILGDWNVYSDEPAKHLSTLLTGDIHNERLFGPDFWPDWDDSWLTDALPRHNGGGLETYTWRDDNQSFAPGELDRILYADSVLSVDHAFVLNTAAMTPADLAASGLQAGDVALDLESGLFDHLPLVVDLSLR